MFFAILSHLELFFCGVSLKTSAGKFRVSAQLDLLPLTEISFNLAPIKISKLSLREKYWLTLIITLTLTANFTNIVQSFHFPFRRNMLT